MAYIRQNGLDVDADQTKLEALRCNVDSPQLSRFDVTNLGIQTLLPVIPATFGHQPGFKAILPCRSCYGSLISLPLEPRGHSFSRPSQAGSVHNKCPEFRLLYLACPQDDEESYQDIRLHDKRASYYGFTRCGTFPRDVAGDVVRLSPQGNNFIVLVYANHDAGCRFAVAVGCYLGQIWARIVCDVSPAKQETWSSWADFAKQAYDILWNAPISKYNFRKAYNIFKDTHLYRSIWDARIVCGSGNTDMMIDIEECPGCCTGPRGCTYASLGYELWLPWTSLRPGLLETHELEIDGQSTWLNKCYDQEIALGDYGEYFSDGSFKHYGNIFENMQELNIDTTGLAYCPDVSRVSGCKRAFRHVQLPHDVVVTSGSSGKSLALSRPTGLSLPNNEEFDLLLKALSTHLAGRHLVTTVVQCSELYEVDHEGESRSLGAALDRSARSSDQGTFTPLCLIARPLAWHKEPASNERRKQFKNIREHFFYILENLRHFAGTAARFKPWDKRKMNAVVNFSAMFGLGVLKNYLGEITFFQRLPSIMEEYLRSEDSTGTAGGVGLSACPSNSSFVRAVTPSLFESRLAPNVGHDSCYETDPPLLLKKCETLGGRSLDETRKTQHDVKTISQTLGVGLLEHIRAFFLDASENYQ